MARQASRKCRLFQKTFELVDDGLSHGIVRHSQNNEALIFMGRIIADVGKIHIPSDNARAETAGAGGNFGVRSVPDPNIAGVTALVTQILQQQQR